MKQSLCILRAALKKPVLLVICQLVAIAAICQPTITSVNPLVGYPASSVTITGANFNTTAANNVVFFGATQAVVNTASATSLTVTVPTGATYMPVSVGNVTTGLTAYSDKPFLPTYNNSPYVADTVHFNSAASFTAGSGPWGVALGDIDGDGKPDLVVTNSEDGTISVFRNTSTSGSITAGSFAAKVNFTVGNEPVYVAISDIDGDGKPDLVVANGSDNTISVLKNTTGGTISFAAQVTYATGADPKCIAIADIDGDGRPDVAVANQNSSYVSLFHNTSSIGAISLATAVNIGSLSSPEGIAISDIDGDGKPDMVVPEYGSTVVAVFRNTSAAGTISGSSFATAVTFSAGNHPEAVAIGDIDGDGKPDLVITNLLDSSISILRNTSTMGAINSGSFASLVSFHTEARAQYVTLGDMDGDGKPDLVVSYYSGYAFISVIRNASTAGSISLAPKVDLTTAGGVFSIAIGDLDGDGKPDIATASITTSAEVFMNNPLPAITGTTTVCAGSSTALAMATTGGTWYSGNPGVAVMGELTGVVTGVAAGTATISYAVSTNITTTVVTVNALPTVSVSPVDAICAGGTTAALGGAFGGVATSAVWTSSDPGGTFAGNDGSAPSATTYTASSGSPSPVTLTLTTSGGACGTASATVLLTVNPNPTVSVASVAAICQGGTTAGLGGTFGGGATSAVWTASPADGTFTGNDGSAPGSTTYTASTGSFSPVTLTLTTLGGSCGSVSATVSLTVNLLPLASIFYPGTPFCATGTASVYRAGTSGGSYSSATGLNINSSTGVINLAVSTPGSYTVTYSVSNGTCSYSTTTNVVVNPLPAISYPGTPYCATGTASVTQTGGGSGAYSASPSGLSINVTTGALNLAASTPGFYAVTYTFSEGSCTSTATAIVDVHPLPTASISYSGGPYCATGAASVLRTGTGGGTYSSAGGLVVNPSAGNIDLALSEPGDYMVTYSFTNGTCSNTTTTPVSVNALPVAGISYPGTPYCATGTASVTQTGASGGNYSSTTGLSINSSTGAINLGASTPGTYTITYSFTNATCSNTTTTNVVVKALPSVSVSPVAAICAGATTAALGGSFGGPAISATWSDGGAGGTFSSDNLTGLTPNLTTYTASAGSSSPVTLTLTTSGGSCGNMSAATSLIVNPNPTPGEIVRPTADESVCVGTESLFPFTDATAANGTGSWSSDNTAIATVDASGNVFGGATAGSANIAYTVSSMVGCGTASTSSPITVLASYTITAPSLAEDTTGGIIWPAGVTYLCPGNGAAYTITPGPGFVVSEVFVDGISQGPITSYSFGGVTGNHTILATYVHACTATYSYTGAIQTYSVPTGVTRLVVDLDGAVGGYGGADGGQGGEITATLVVTPGQVLNIYVGGLGASGSAGGAGGYNGGGTGSNDDSGDPGGGGGGGGASDIRIGGTDLAHRIIVAGGGGGGGTNPAGGFGGAGGGLTGQTGSGVTSFGGAGGDQYSGGAGGGIVGVGLSLVGEDGMLGIGGAAATAGFAGGGGGGYYGGGGGAASAGGGGGSSTIDFPHWSVSGQQGGSPYSYGQVTISAPAPSAGTITNGAQSICAGAETATPYADATAANGSGSWSSDNTSVASVDDGGNVYGGATPGIANIMYTVTGSVGCGSVTTSSPVTVNALPIAGSITNGAQSICPGAETASPYADATAANGTGSWSSDNTSVASVDDGGNVYGGTMSGTANIFYTVTSSLGCGSVSTSSPVTVIPPPAVTLSASSGSLCVGYSATTVESGAASYSWSPSSGVSTVGSTVSFYPAVTTVYTVTGTGLCGAGTATFTATVNSAPSFAPGTCLAGSSTGSIVLGSLVQNADPGACSAGAVSYTIGTAAESGSLPITYTSFPGSGSSMPDGITYVDVTATNACGSGGCEIQIIITPNTLSGSSSETDATCYGYNNGTISVSAGGGSGSYYYILTDDLGDEWDHDGDGSYTFTGLYATDLAGNYYVSVTDDDCSATNAYSSTLTVGEPAAISFTSAISETDATCNGYSNGSISTSVTGGNGSFIYSWTPLVPGTGGANPLDVAAGTYSVSVTDGSGCPPAAGSVTVNQPTAITYTSVNPINTSCNAANGGNHNNGTITVTGLAGGTPGGGYTYLWTDPSAQTKNPATGLAAGTYSVTISDANGCTAAASATVGQPAAMAYSTTIDNATCHGLPDGYIEAAASGGTPGYTYTWNTGGEGIPLGNNLYFAPAGVYTVTATDAHSCTLTATYTVTQPGALSITATTANLSCYGSGSGSITTTVTGGTPGYNYLWSTGSRGADLSGLPAGAYTVAVTDANGCITGGSYGITQPAPLNLTAATANVTCYGGSNGSINTTVTGGTLPYSYHWSNGASAANLTGLAGGTYSVTVTDGHGCTTTGSYVISQPVAVSVTATTTSVTCNGGSNGSINTTVSSGAPGYAYIWSNGSHAANPSGLTAGTYSVTVTDERGCTATGAFTVNQPSPISIAAKVADVTCYGSKNGSITISVSGGTAGYTYVWSNGSHTASLTGLAPAIYTLTVTDAHGCTATTAYTITQPAALSLSATVTNASCSGCSNGSIHTAVSGGTPAYSYLWSDGLHIADPTGLAAGTYSVTVTDANGCTIKGSYTVTQPAKGKGGSRTTGGDGTTGVGTIGTTYDEIKLYPNPTEGIFSVVIPQSQADAEIQITDVAGNIIDHRSVTGNTGAPVQFSLNNVARGIYIVNVSAGDITFVTKLVVR